MPPRPTLIRCRRPSLPPLLLLLLHLLLPSPLLLCGGASERPATTAVRVVIAQGRDGWFNNDSQSWLEAWAKPRLDGDACFAALRRDGCECSYGSPRHDRAVKSERRAYMAELRRADALLFYVKPRYNRSEFPRRQLWATATIEPERHLAEYWARGVDVESSWRRAANAFTSYVVPGRNFAEETGDPVEMEKFSSRAAPGAGGARDEPLVAAFITHCKTSNKRVEYMKALMAHPGLKGRIDSFGKCANTRDEKDILGPEASSGYDAGAKLKILKRYKFHLAFENNDLEDYVTEKLFQSFVAGTVPVYMGAPNVDDFAPGDGAIIRTADFASPEALAEHLLALDADDGAYAALHAWRAKPLRPQFLELVERHNIRQGPCLVCAALCDAKRRLAADPGAVAPSFARARAFDRTSAATQAAAAADATEARDAYRRRREDRARRAADHAARRERVLGTWVVGVATLVVGAMLHVRVRHRFECVDMLLVAISIVCSAFALYCACVWFDVDERWT